MLVGTYRLQLTPDFGFAAAAAIIPHLARLGVSHVYLSPIFEAVPGSQHGYDQTDPTRLRAELGGSQAFEEFVAACRERGLSILIDFVPNHMAAHASNPWWWDTLRLGSTSPWARAFDIDWDRGRGKVHLPVLAKPLEEAIAAREIALKSRGDLGPHICFFDHSFPLAPGSERDVDPAKPRGLKTLLDRQHYRLLDWRTGLPHLNYRRFFDINGLVGVRANDPAVFETFHKGLFDLIARGMIDALRLDHIDGLLDPLAYLQLLRSGIDALGRPGHFPIFVEKILTGDERLPPEWPVDGTTGYEFAAGTALLAVDPVGAASMQRAARDRSGTDSEPFERLKVHCKEDVARASLVPELAALTDLGSSCAIKAAVAVQPAALRSAIVALSACLDVYRTYATARAMSEPDRRRLRDAAQRAADGASSQTAAAIELVFRMLTLQGPFGQHPARCCAVALLERWQQFTGPLAAKGVEDTALARETAVLALCEVGCEPVASADAADRLAAVLRDRRQPHALSLNATTTHDTKRGEDTRLRLAALTHAPAQWAAHLGNWLARHQPLLSQLPSGVATPPADALAIYQTVVALYQDDPACLAPLVERLKAFATKSAREGKMRSTWAEPDQEYESACHRFIDSLLLEDAGSSFRADVAALIARTRPRAAAESLCLVLLKALAPGVPDFYQGSEFPDLSLVDPDNRRPVDWAARQSALLDLAREWNADPASTAMRLLQHPDSPGAKLLVTWRALACRRWLLGDHTAITDISDDCAAHLRLDEFARARTGSIEQRVWITYCGKRRCHVVAIIPPLEKPHCPPPTPRTASSPGDFGVDQLTGLPSGDAGTRSPVVIVLEGMSELVKGPLVSTPVTRSQPAASQ